MKKRVALGACLMLSLGTAVGATMIYGHEREQSAPDFQMSLSAETEMPSPEVLAAWKASASTADYITPKVPI